MCYPYAAMWTYTMVVSHKWRHCIPPFFLKSGVHEKVVFGLFHSFVLWFSSSLFACVSKCLLYVNGSIHVHRWCLKPRPSHVRYAHIISDQKSSRLLFTLPASLSDAFIWIWEEQNSKLTFSEHFLLCVSFLQQNTNNK